MMVQKYLVTKQLNIKHEPTESVKFLNLTFSALCDLAITHLFKPYFRLLSLSISVL